MQITAFYMTQSAFYFSCRRNGGFAVLYKIQVDYDWRIWTSSNFEPVEACYCTRREGERRAEEFYCW